MGRSLAVHFCGVGIPTTAKSKPPGCHRTWSWKEMCKGAAGWRQSQGHVHRQPQGGPPLLVSALEPSKQAKASSPSADSPTLALPSAGGRASPCWLWRGFGWGSSGRALCGIDHGWAGLESPMRPHWHAGTSRCKLKVCPG